MNQTTIDENMMKLAEEAIKKGEQSRILFEMLLSHLGCTFDDSLEDVYKALKKNQDEYNEAVKMLAAIVYENKKQTHKNGSTPYAKIVKMAHGIAEKE